MTRQEHKLEKNWRETDASVRSDSDLKPKITDVKFLRQANLNSYAFYAHKAPPNEKWQKMWRRKFFFFLLHFTRLDSREYLINLILQLSFLFCVILYVLSLIMHYKYPRWRGIWENIFHSIIRTWWIVERAKVVKNVSESDNPKMFWDFVFVVCL